MASGLITTYLAAGPLTDRPLAPDIDLTTDPLVLCFWFATDTGALTFYDPGAAAWSDNFGVSVSWGDITGTLTDQADLVTYIAAQITAAVNALVDSAPGALDTLNELAAALADDANFAATVTTALAGKIDTSALATVADYRSGAADKVLETDTVWAAAASVALTPGANVAVDLDSGINFTLAMGGAYQLSTPTNGKDGQTGKIECTQDGTGSRLLTFAAGWVFADGTPPTLSTAAGALDVLFYAVLASGDVFVSKQGAIA